MKAIAEGVQERSAKKGLKPLGIEGLSYSHWVLIDYGDVIFHIFEEETRLFYELEKLWMDAKRVSLGKHNNE